MNELEHAQARIGELEAELAALKARAGEPVLTVYRYTRPDGSTYFSQVLVDEKRPVEVPLYAAPPAAQAQQKFDLSRVAQPTCDKTEDPTQKKGSGLGITGFVFTNGYGQKCIVDDGIACWFLNGNDFVQMMNKPTLAAWPPAAPEAPKADQP